jgi:predicted DNA-binding ribbon-helix-helix protein
MIGKRSMTISGRSTSVSLEDAFWDALRDIAKQRGLSISELILSVSQDRKRNSDNLSSALRVFVLQHYQDRATR